MADGLKTIVAVVGRDDMDGVREEIERVISVKFEPRDSSYLGGAYYGAGGQGGESIMLTRNYVSAIDDYLEDDYKEWPLLLRIYMTPRADQFVRALEQIPQLSIVRVSPSARS